MRIGLSAVVLTVRDDALMVLTTAAPDGTPALPFGPFDPDRDRTFELALRGFVTRQTGLELGHVEQLYTFGDAGRGAVGGSSAATAPRDVSVGYLALTRPAPTTPAGAAGDAAAWTDVRRLFPWEDRRPQRAPPEADPVPALLAWAEGDVARLRRVEGLFAVRPDARWDEETALERYELLYEAGLTAEAARDSGRAAPTGASGLALASDHRRILATGLGRLRAKLKYRPVLFDLAPPAFTLGRLQATAEAAAGLALHKQNFRRGVLRTDLVRPTGRFVADTGGRPAELYAFAADAAGGAPNGPRLDGRAPGVALPARRERGNPPPPLADPSPAD